jgi:hypothetical protein
VLFALGRRGGNDDAGAFFFGFEAQAQFFERSEVAIRFRTPASFNHHAQLFDPQHERARMANFCNQCLDILIAVIVLCECTQVMYRWRCKWR